MIKKALVYSHGASSFKGYLAYTETSAKKPAILIAHAWRGQDDFARKKADELAEMGYVAFAVDYYGDGKEVTSNEEASALMQPLFQDRAFLLHRMQAAFETLKALPFVDATRIGAIGFCFGGLATIELFRSGTPLKAAVSFHGQLCPKLPLAPHIKGSLLILHGYDDTGVPEKDVRAIQSELNEAHIDWQIHIFGGTMHAFMVPGTNSPEHGLKYNERSAKRAWKLMQQHFQETLS